MSLEELTDQDWEHLAQRDPYWAVQTCDDYKRANMTSAKKAQFFQGGEELVSHLLRVLEQRLQAPRHFGTSLDFGCGVGRLTIPLARRCDTVIGVDIAQSMLRLCVEHARECGLSNLQVLDGNESRAQLHGKIDLLLSYIVFQHIPPDRGLMLLAELLDLVKPGGYGCVQLTFANDVFHIAGEGSNPHVRFKYYQRQGAGLRRMLRTEISEPAEMQMNHYDLNEVMCVFLDRGITETFSGFTNHGGHLGVELFFRK